MFYGVVECVYVVPYNRNAVAFGFEHLLMAPLLTRVGYSQWCGQIGEKQGQLSLSPSLWKT
jgi:hypothetical protein